MDARDPDATLLGPDPEPFGQRFERLAAWPAPVVRRERVLGPPRTCPIHAAFGESTACAGDGCPFWHVPGARYACAVDEWSPRARRDPQVAEWFRGVKERVVANG